MPAAASRTTRAFTMIELLAAIGIIAILAGLIIAARPGAAARRAANARLASQVGDAISAYLLRHPLVGEDFALNPYRYLHDLPLQRGDTPWIELPLARLAVREPSGLRAAAEPGEGTAVRDYSPGRVNELRVWIPLARERKNARPLTHAVVLWTTSGTPDTRDDVFRTFLLEDAQWQTVDRAGFDAFRADQGPAAAPSLEP